jgi:hypothetical protein
MAKTKTATYLCDRNEYTISAEICTPKSILIKITPFEENEIEIILSSQEAKEFFLSALSMIKNA